MTYAKNLGLTPVTTMLGPANSDFFLTDAGPSPLLAGPGKQRVTLHGSGLHLHRTLSVGAWSDQGASTGNTLEDVNADGTMGHVTLDFQGVAGPWQIQAFDPHSTTNAESNPLVVQVYPGMPTAYDPNSISSAFAEGRLAPVVVQRVPAYGGDGTRVIITGGIAWLPSPNNGPSQRYDASGPGLLYNDPGGTWRFVGIDDFSDHDRAAAEEVFQTPMTYGRTVDLFGIPLPGAGAYGEIPEFWPDGRPVVSPWAAGFAAHAWQSTPDAAGGSVGGAGGTLQPPTHTDDPTDPTALVPDAHDPSGSALPSAAPVPPAPFTPLLQQVVPVNPSTMSPAALLLAAGVLVYLATGKRGN